MVNNMANIRSFIIFLLQIIYDQFINIYHTSTLSYIGKTMTYTKRENV